MPLPTRQETLGSIRQVLEPINAEKRTLSEDVTRDAKRQKKADKDTPVVRDRRKRKRKKRKLPVIAVNNIRSPSMPISSARTSTVVCGRSSSSTGANNQALSRECKATSRLSRRTHNAPSEDASTPAGPLRKTEHHVSDVSRQPSASNAFPDPQQQASSPSESAEDKIAQLTRELEIKKELVTRHENLLTQIQQSVTCQICLSPFQKPYALAPCGHLACHSCLVEWFTAPPPDGQAPPRSNYLRKKTCPHCRAEIKERPAEVWGIKSIVNGLIKSGLVPDFNYPAVLNANTNQNEANPDPWDGVFRKPADHDHPFFGPAVPPQAGVGGQDMGIYDVEDGGIYRCLDCMHEIWDGECSGCHRVYPGHQHNEADLEDMLDMRAQGHDGDVRAYFGGWGWGYVSNAYLRQPGYSDSEEEVEVSHLEEVEPVDDEHEEEGYESSFIDDEIDNPPRRHLIRQTLVDTDDADNSPVVTHVRGNGPSWTVGDDNNDYDDDSDDNYYDNDDDDYFDEGEHNVLSPRVTAQMFGCLTRVRQDLDGVSDASANDRRGGPSTRSTSRRVVESDFDWSSD